MPVRSGQLMISLSSAQAWAAGPAIRLLQTPRLQRQPRVLRHLNRMMMSVMLMSHNHQHHYPDTSSASQGRDAFVSSVVWSVTASQWLFLMLFATLLTHSAPSPLQAALSPSPSPPPSAPPPPAFPRPPSPSPDPTCRLFASPPPCSTADDALPCTLGTSSCSPDCSRCLASLPYLSSARRRLSRGDQGPHSESCWATLPCVALAHANHRPSSFVLL